MKYTQWSAEGFSCEAGQVQLKAGALIRVVELAPRSSYSRGSLQRNHTWNGKRQGNRSCPSESVTKLTAIRPFAVQI